MITPDLTLQQYDDPETTLYIDPQYYETLTLDLNGEIIELKPHQVILLVQTCNNWLTAHEATTRIPKTRLPKSAGRKP
jgi:hypothetical protein